MEETYKSDDIRWKQRFSNYKKALSQLQKFIQKGELTELEEQGLIKAFEYTYELSWNVLKDYMVYQGSQLITGSRDAIREAFSAGIIEEGEVWMDMFKSRNKTVHTYNEETATEIVNAVFNVYNKLFLDLEKKMETFL